MQTLVNGVPWNANEIAALKEFNLKKAPKPHQFEKNGKIWERTAEPCPRCGGSGRYPSLEYQGVCLKCMGDGFFISERRVLTDKEKAQRERAKARKAEKKAQELEAQMKKWEEEKAQKEAEAKAKAEEKAQKLAKLQWIGEVGQKVELTLTLQVCKVFYTDYGTKYFQVMTTPEGNKVIYSGKDLFPNPEEQNTITATFKIKSHDESEDWGKSTKVSLR